MKPRVSVNGQAIEPPQDADVLEVETGVFSVLADGKSYEARRSAGTVTISGQEFAVAIEDPRRWKPEAASRGARGLESIKALMPGKIVRVMAAVGDEVRAGQGLIVMEAMKMQNEMKSPRDGRVTAVLVRKEETVTAGAPLLTIE